MRNNTDWINIFSIRPPYYKPVKVRTISNDLQTIQTIPIQYQYYTAWLAIDDNGEYVWTIYDSDRIIDDVCDWKPI